MIETGSPEFLGANPYAGGTNFAVYSPAATGMELCLFDASGDETARIEMPAQTGGVWHGFAPGVTAGQRYGFRAHGRYEADAGLRFNPNQLLVDPYAREISGDLKWCDAIFDFKRGAGLDEFDELDPSEADSAPFVPKSVVAAGDRPVASRCRAPWPESLIYELNVRGFTMRHPAIGPDDAGRFSALGTQAIVEHFKALGITSVELMPIHAFVDEEFLHSKGLRNFWGYNSLAFFAADPRYLGSDGASGLRSAIQTLHAANIEVLLDVVYNHTAEGGRLGPTLSFRGLANSTYYRLAADAPGQYVNDTGCGNTINTDDPVVRRLIVDSLSYWVTQFGIDGFRFDLATILGRSAAGFGREHVLFDEIRQAPALKDVKLIAEPWDVGPGGYRLGAFPADWAEWNDQYRDTVRRFWNCEAGVAPDFARRVHGSSDIFEAGGRGPAASVNFVASHDGFTTADVVSFVARHNEANGEQNRDGHQHNFSVNHGVEGATGDLSVLGVRRRHRINLIATLLFSQGTPMLLAGDEFGNTQSGNNNAYAQDNDTGWIDWAGLASDPDFFEVVRSLIQLRRDVPLLRQCSYRHGETSTVTGQADIVWFGAGGHEILPEQWPQVASLGILLSRPDDAERSGAGELAVAILFNARFDDCEFSLPAIEATGRWTCRFSSAGDQLPTPGENLFRATGFSVACLTYA